MRIIIGSKNPNKVGAVREQIADYPLFRDVVIEGMATESEVSHQPQSLEETMRGAMNRARNAFLDCDYSFGIESGLIEVPYSKSNFMNVTICAIYDGKNFHQGVSSGFELPVQVIKTIFEERIELDAALVKTGVVLNPRIGYEKGIIHFLTNGRMDRKDFTKEAIRMALIHLEHPELY